MRCPSSAHTGGASPLHVRHEASGPLSLERSRIYAPFPQPQQSTAQSSTPLPSFQLLLQDSQLVDATPGGRQRSSRCQKVPLAVREPADATLPLRLPREPDEHVTTLVQKRRNSPGQGLTSIDADALLIEVNLVLVARTPLELESPPPEPLGEFALVQVLTDGDAHRPVRSTHARPHEGPP